MISNKLMRTYLIIIILIRPSVKRKKMIKCRHGHPVFLLPVAMYPHVDVLMCPSAR